VGRALWSLYLKEKCQLHLNGGADDSKKRKCLFFSPFFHLIFPLEKHHESLAFFILQE